MNKPIQLYFWSTPNGWKITIALEEMGLAYELKPVNIGAGEQFTPQFLAISPNNRMPALVDPDGPGGTPISVFESGAMLQYLGRKSGKFYPSDERARVMVDEWLFWQMAGVGPMFGQVSHFRNYAPSLIDDPSQLDYARTRYGNEMNRLCGVFDRRLEGRDFVADMYSIADMALYPWLKAAVVFGQDMARFPRLEAWLQRLADRPGVQRGLTVGGEFRRPPPGSPEQIAAAKVLFGQTAESIAESANRQSAVGNRED
jgi:GSH-dependent disulfide-bond oxidoreductase